MTVRDQIPSFPRLIHFRSLVDAVAHGTEDPHRISEKYYSTAERTYAEELATEKILSLVRQGLIRATGRMSETKKGSAARWEAQQYKQHSKLRSYIEVEFWRTAVIPKSVHYLYTARTEEKEYTDILLVLDDCVKHLADDLAAHQDAAESEAAAANSDYSTPYIELMWQAIDHFEISRENQPIKENLVEWFLAQQIAGQNISRSTAEYLASFVRLPESRTGGNRPWKVRAQQQQKDE
jgi:hypothetical protein